MAESTFIAIGGGSLGTATAALERIFVYLKEKSDPRMVVMTVATNEGDGLSEKYNTLFRKRNVNHVEMVHVWQREDAFNEVAVNKIRNADGIFFTGGDQLNVTGLMGGTPLDAALKERVKNGVL